jgi:2-polyprenyl-3-methyl-5-hydroxy-6-metoxy-1,4-benzoquinol methylase
MSNALFMKIYTRTRIKSFYNLFSKIDPINRTCLEIGAGTGYISKLLAKKYHMDITLVDNDREAYKMFQKVSREGKYIISDAFSFKPEENFDIVFSDGLIEHFYRKERMEMILVHKNLAKPNGFVIIFVPKKSWFVENLFTMNGVLELKYDYSQLETELKEAGLRPIAWAEDWHMIGMLSRVA